MVAEFIREDRGGVQVPTSLIALSGVLNMGSSWVGALEFEGGGVLCEGGGVLCDDGGVEPGDERGDWEENAGDLGDVGEDLERRLGCFGEPRSSRTRAGRVGESPDN